MEGQQQQQQQPPQLGALGSLLQVAASSAHIPQHQPYSSLSSTTTNTATSNSSNYDNQNNTSFFPSLPPASSFGLSAFASPQSQNQLRQNSNQLPPLAAPPLEYQPPPLQQQQQTYIPSAAPQSSYNLLQQQSEYPPVTLPPLNNVESIESELEAFFKWFAPPPPTTTISPAGSFELNFFQGDTNALGGMDSLRAGEEWDPLDPAMATSPREGWLNGHLQQLNQNEQENHQFFISENKYQELMEYFGLGLSSSFSSLAPTSSVLSAHLSSYFLHFHPTCPMIHVPTFRVEKTRVELLGAIVVAGASLLIGSGGQEEEWVKVAGKEGRKGLVRFRISSCYPSSSSHLPVCASPDLLQLSSPLNQLSSLILPLLPLQLFQALIILNIVSHASASKDEHELGHVFHSLEVGFGRKGGWFCASLNSSNARGMSSIKEEGGSDAANSSADSESSLLESKWLLWSDEEMRKRTTWMIAVRDVRSLSIELPSFFVCSLSFPLTLLISISPSFLHSRSQHLDSLVLLTLVPYRWSTLPSTTNFLPVPSPRLKSHSHFLARKLSFQRPPRLHGQRWVVWTKTQRV